MDKTPSLLLCLGLMLAGSFALLIPPGWPRLRARVTSVLGGVGMATIAYGAWAEWGSTWLWLWFWTGIALVNMGRAMRAADASSPAS